MTKQIQTSTPDLQGVRGAQPPVARDDLDREISPYDTEAEPDDLAAMELALSETTEDDTKLTGEEQDECCGWPPKDEEGCCDMPLEKYDPEMSKSIQEEMEEMALAEPEPPEEDSNGKP